MRWFSKLTYYVKSLFQRRKRDAQLSEEIQSHVDMAAEANIAAGMSPEEARYAALREFGNVASVQERTRDEHGWAWLENFRQDLRLAIRMAVRSPGFSAIVLATLGCAIGATTAVFSGVNALLLRPLPVRDSSRLVVAAAVGGGVGTGAFPYPLFEQTGDNFAFPYAFYTAFRDRSTTLSAVVAVTGWPMGRAVVAADFGATEPATTIVEEVSGNYFAALGVPLACGRGLGDADDQPGADAAVAVVSHDFWQGRLGGDPGVIGKRIRLDGNPVTIIGVAGRGFTGAQVGLRCDLWFPIRQSALLDANMPWGTQVLQDEHMPLVHILGRLRADFSREQAAAEMDGLFQHKLAELDPRRQAAVGSPGWTGLLEQHLALASAGAGYGGRRQSLQTPLGVLLALVAMLQMAACANVAGLLLARGTAREHEFAVRAALGASRGRIVSQLFTESLLLASVAGGLGMLLALVAVRFLQSAAAGLDLALDARVGVFAAGLTLLTALGAGLVPAWRLSRRELSGKMKPLRPARSRMNAALVASQISIAFVLLAVAGLFVRTLQNVTSADTGYERRNRLIFDLGLAPETPAPERAEVYQRIAANLESLPGVERATYYQGIDLLGDTAFVLGFEVPGLELAPGPERKAAILNVGPRFFETLGLPLLRGRDFGERDEAVMGHGMPALVIGAWAARQLFGENDPLGRRIRMGGQDFEIVGVAKDIKYGALREEPRFIFYEAARVTPNTMRMNFALRTAAAPVALAGSIRKIVQQIDGRAQLSGFRTITDRLDESTVQERFTARLAGFFGGFALTLSGLGLFGTMSFLVSRRTREIGIRLALGAPPGGILRMVAREGLVLWGLGCAFGVAGALGLTRAVASLLYQVSPLDPTTFLLAGGTLLMVAGFACWWPAHRAARVDPAITLRAE